MCQHCGWENKQRFCDTWLVYFVINVSKYVELRSVEKKACTAPAILVSMSLQGLPEAISFSSTVFPDEGRRTTNRRQLWQEEAGETRTRRGRGGRRRRLSTAFAVRYPGNFFKWKKSISDYLHFPLKTFPWCRLLGSWGLALLMQRVRERRTSPYSLLLVKCLRYCNIFWGTTTA